jgi:hypothetical protein
MGWLASAKYGSVITMQRFQAIFLIALMLALPLALLADARSGAMGMCDGYCCLPHGHHAAQMPQVNQRTSEEKPADGMSCHHGAATHPLNCTMKSNNHGMDYSILAPLAPTNLSSRVKLLTPVAARRAFVEISQQASSGYLSAPFEPPRA